MSRSNRFLFAFLSGVVFFIAIAYLLRSPLSVPASPADITVVGLIGLACVLMYLASHLLRAIRLAVIGVYIHKTSFRTLALLNLAVAPWTMIAPFKIDELIRLNELRTINNSVSKAIMTIVIDRAMDGPLFVLFAITLSVNGMYKAGFYAGLIGAGMISVTIGFFAASGVLQFLQNYIFLHHYKPRAVRTLRIVDRLRKLALLGRETIKTTSPILLICTLGIWAFETGAVALLLSTFYPQDIGLSGALSATLIRANSGWRAILLGDQLGFPAALITKIFLTGLLIIWPLAIWFYCRRRLLEISNSDFLGRRWGYSE